QLQIAHGDTIEARYFDTSAGSNRTAIAVADFVCPTEETRAAFGEAFVVWVDRIDQGRFEDTNRLFTPPTKYDVRVTSEGAPEFWADAVCGVFLKSSRARSGARSLHEPLQHPLRKAAR
ncbi:MAG: hypothetical protein N2444_01965, partial [Methylocystis sp.]|nr:hypothetical protein [Methylocystis sp.]